MVLTEYDNTQHSPWIWLMGVIALVMFGAAVYVPITAVRAVLMVSGGVMLLLMAVFAWLRVYDAGDALVVSFGPLPLLRRRIEYARIERAEPARTTLIEGWGIHLAPGGGWTWNVWGFDCVDLWIDGKRRLRIGTQEPDQLTAFLARKITA